MEGLLGAELAGDRQRETRSWARAQFEHRGRKGWLTKSDLLELYAGVRQHGVSELDARALLNSFRAEADVRHWAWAGASPTPSEMDDRLQLLVGKVAAQARRRRDVTKGYRQALLAEVAGANVDTRMLLDAVAERRRREHWSASFDPCWDFGGDESSSWWERTFLHMPIHRAEARCRSFSRRPASSSELAADRHALAAVADGHLFQPSDSGVVSSNSSTRQPAVGVDGANQPGASVSRANGADWGRCGARARQRSATQAGRVAYGWWGRTATDRAGDRTRGAAAG
jgi:hypothetical protein